MSLPTLSPAFQRLGPAEPLGPVIVAVPHAGRIYPPALLAEARLPQASLERLEDRHADLLVADAIAAGTTAFVATMARAWIDLNRDPRELDPAMVAGSPAGLIATVKTRGGLGLVPSRIAGQGAIHAHPLSYAEVAARIAGTHAPWHAALTDTLEAAQARFGIAILVDLHSMPRLPGARPALMVVGDRHRRSAAPRFVATAMRHGAADGLRPALNAPYAGGYTLDRHGRPADGIHALQIEVCRSLYLDEADRPMPGGVAMLRRLVARLVSGLTTEAQPRILAAE